MSTAHPIIGIVLVFWSLAIPVSIARPASQLDSVPRELTVSVRSSDTPLQGVVVLLERLPGERRVSITSREGLCKFRGLEPGNYSLQIQLRSYFIAPEQRSQLAHFEISRGQEHSIKIGMVKGGVITGRVLSPNGRSIIGVPLTAMEVNPESATTILPSAEESNITALSDDRGEFRIYGLRPGRYAIAANAQRNLFPLRSANTIYYPAQREATDARLFDVFVDQETKALEMVFDLDGGNQNTLRGRVVGPRLTGIESVSLSLEQISGGSITDSSSSDREGFFDFEGLPSGKYLVKAESSQGSYFAAEKQVTIKDFEKTELTLELRHYVTIAGNVYFRNKIQTNLVSLNIRLASSMTGASINFASDKEGVFSARSGHKGLFWWTFPGLTRENFVEKISLGSKDITYRPLELDDTLTLNEISIRVAAGAAKIGGRFNDENGSGCLRYHPYAVAMETDNDEILFVRGADSCTKDSFSFYSLRPGRYYVFALPVDLSARPHTRFEIVDDYQVQLIERAIDRFKRTNNKPLLVKKYETYQDIVPTILR